MNSYDIIHYTSLFMTPLSILGEVSDFLYNLAEGMPVTQASDKFWAAFGDKSYPTPSPLDVIIVTLSAIFWFVTTPIWVPLAAMYALR